ncbi:MAG: hypothetical protein VKK05_09270, partial [Synechococcus sp.]|nr:hypothetical protein [Synechococcus sp.]
RVFLSIGIDGAGLIGVLAGGQNSGLLQGRISVQAGVTSGYVNIGHSSGTGQFSVDNISVKELPGNHAVAANNGTARPVLKSTGGLYYLAFTTDDAMSTASIDFSGTDEMTVFAGVTKNSDAAAGCLIELSANYSSSNGTFTVFAPGSNFPTGFDTPYRGTSTVTAPGFAAAAPTTKIITNLYDISSPSAIIRSNGSQVFSSTTSAGTGNFGNHPLYIGARNKSASFLNGSLYSLIVRGKTSTVDEIHSTENYVAGKTGLGTYTWAFEYLVDDSGNQITTDSGDSIFVNETLTITPP